MTPAPEKAAPIPADVLAKQYAAKACVGAWTVEEAVLNAILADREARPSLPDSREEPGYLVRIAFREGRSSGLRITSPDVPGLILSHHDEPAILADMVQVLREADRARARQGGNNG